MNLLVRFGRIIGQLEAAQAVLDEVATESITDPDFLPTSIEGAVRDAWIAIRDVKVTVSHAATVLRDHFAADV